MSKENVKDMFEKIKNDEEFQKKYLEMARDYQKESEKIFFDMLVEFGEKTGFSFSPDDILSARSEYIENENANKELLENDLETVAGGMRGTHWASAAPMSVNIVFFRCVG
ncbi:MAG: Nif11 family protein [Candidatus Wallbacteria bacterium]